MSKFRFLWCIFGGAVLCIYYANEFSILPLFFLFSSFCISFILPLSCSFLVLFLFFSCFVLLLLIRAICPNMCFVISFLIPLLCYFVYGLNDTLIIVPRYHVTRYHVIKLPYYLWSQLEALQLEVSQTCHVICALCAVRRCYPELLCGGSFCSCWGVHRRPPAGVVNTFKLTC